VPRNKLIYYLAFKKKMGEKLGNIFTELFAFFGQREQ